MILERFKRLSARGAHEARRLAHGGRRILAGDRLFLDVLPPGTLPFLRTFEPGHFYSPIPDLDELAPGRGAQAERAALESPALTLNDAVQRDLVERLGAFFEEFPYLEPSRESGLRFTFEGQSAFREADAVALYGMLRHLRPRRIVEVGSGYSSALMLDTAERHLRPGGGEVAFTFIDPYPALVRSLVKEGDRCEIIGAPVQQVPFAPFAALGDGDVLFIDSSHVVKMGSDVLHLVFEVLPRLSPGVVVHFHDIFWPFDYPDAWVREGRAWNEAYLLRAFLSFNDAFEILLFNSYLGAQHRDLLQRHLPASLENTGGSLWLRKTR